MANIRWQPAAHGPDTLNPHCVLCYDEAACWPHTGPGPSGYNAYYLGYVQKRRNHWLVVTWDGPADSLLEEVNLRCVWAAKTMEEAQSVLITRNLLTAKE